LAISRRWEKKVARKTALAPANALAVGGNALLPASLVRGRTPPQPQSRLLRCQVIQAPPHHPSVLRRLGRQPCPSRARGAARPDRPSILPGDPRGRRDDSPLAVDGQEETVRDLGQGGALADEHVRPEVALPQRADLDQDEVARPAQGVEDLGADRGVPLLPP